MEFRVLEYFLTIAREQSFSKAAEHLHITQPTLSRQIAELEEEIGKKLFVRGTRKLTLTEEGLLLKQRAEEMITIKEKTKMELMSNESNIFGDVYIGGGETIGMSIIAKVIKQVQIEHPNIKFHLFSGNADSVIEKIEKGLLDFGVLVHSKGTDQYVNIELPIKDSFGILMRKDDELANKEFVTLDEIINKPLIVSAQGNTGNAIINNYKFEDLKDKSVASYNLIYNASLLVKEGVGYCFCLDNLINTEGTNLVFKPLVPKIEAELTLIYKKYQTFSKASNYFLEKLKQEIKKESSTN